MIAIGGDMRLAASHIQEHDGADGAREIPRDTFLAFCGELEQLDDESLVTRFRLPAVEAETLVPSLLVYRTLLSETAARNVVVSDASLRAGMLLELLEPGGPRSTSDFEQQVLASAESLGRRFCFDQAHGRPLFSTTSACM
jgi:exopolyphosphatase/guanosine-5'-triphosphate,3'-diphosphate pyrophosphatase